MYYNGNGVPKDDVQAYAWFSVAKANGLNESKAALLDISGDLIPAQLDKAREFAAQYIEHYPSKED